jgi:hypothetical protein
MRQEKAREIIDNDPRAYPIERERRGMTIHQWTL